MLDTQEYDEIFGSLAQVVDFEYYEASYWITYCKITLEKII